MATEPHSSNGLTTSTDPSHQLPPEILSLIFLHCLPGAPAPIQQHPAFPISGVCGRWRAVSLCTSHLWASFAFALSPYHWKGKGVIAEYGPPNVKLLELFLGRAGTSRLTLQTCLDVSGSNDLGSLRLFLGASNNWFDLRMQFVGDALFQPNGIQNDLRRLEHLHLTEVNPIMLDSPSSGQFTIYAFGTAPSLRNVILTSVSHARDVRLPVAQLAALALCSVQTRSKIPNVLLSSHLRLIDVWWQDPAPESSCFPSLSSLELSYSGSVSHIPTPIHSFVTPHLSTLTIKNSKHVSLHCVSSLLARSTCVLHNLILHTVWFRGRDIIHFLPRIASLRSLTLIDLLPHAVTDQVLEALTNQSCPPLLPHLEHFHLQGSYVFRNCTLLAMIHSRAGRAATLRNVELTLRDRPMDRDVVSSLRKLAKIGVKMTLCCLDEINHLGRVI